MQSMPDNHNNAAADLTPENPERKNQKAKPDNALVSRGALVWRTLRQISRQQWLYLPRLFSRQERRYVTILLTVAAVAFAILNIRIFLKFTEVQPAVGGIIREGALQEPRFINPIFASNDTDRDITSIVFGKLIRYDRDGRPTMDLAERLDVSDDGKTYTIALRPNIRWHDGESFSADDVIFTVKTIQDPDYKSLLRSNWQGVVAEKVDDLTIRFVLRQTYAPFLENLSVGILPEHLWRKIPRASAILSDLNLKPIGTGPYRFDKFTREENGTITSIVLARNKHYHLRGPYFKEILFLFYPTEAKLVAAYRRNDIDSFLLVSHRASDEVKTLDIVLSELKFPKIFGIFLNANIQPALSRKAVREALKQAIDQDAIIADVLSGNGMKANSAIPLGTFGHNADIPPHRYDPEKAKKFLADDGWSDADHDGLLERVEGSGKKRTVQKLEIDIVTSDAPELVRSAELIAAHWRAIGVKTVTKFFNVQDLENVMIRPRAYAALLFGEVFGHDPDPFAFWHTSQLKDPGLNIALYSNRTVDQLLEEARRTHDPTLREQKYREFQRIVSDDVGAIFLYSPRDYYATRKNVRGVELGTITLPEERFNSINQWYQKTRRAVRLK